MVLDDGTEWPFSAEFQGAVVRAFGALKGCTALEMSRRDAYWLTIILEMALDHPLCKDRAREVALRVRRSLLDEVAPAGPLRELAEVLHYAEVRTCTNH